jgi:HlyD family secretion protein
MNRWRRMAAAIWLTAGACGGGGEAAEEPSGIAVAERTDLEVRVEAAGLVEPILVVEVKSKATGEVQSLQVETGDVVGRGELLATIDPRDARTELTQAQANAQAAQARLSNAQIQLTRARALRDAQIITEQEYEIALLETTNAEAELVRARTGLDLARERMGDVTIRAPIDGTIIEKTVEIGQIVASASQNVSGGTTLLRMADLSTMQVRALVDETDIGRIVSGLPATITVEAYPERTFRGEVLKVEPQAVVEQNVTMFPVLVRLDNEEGLLKPGMNAEVAIDIALRENVIVVPNAAVVAPREASAAAEALGLDPEALGAGLGSGGAGGFRPGAGGSGGGEAGRPGGVGSDRSGGEAGAVGPPAAGRIRREARGADAGSGAPSDVETRPAIVFVETPDGPAPRRVRLGVNDWDRSEVVSGLEAGERVYLVSVARLKQQQEEFEQRVRERTGGGIPGSGGGTSGGGSAGRRGGS